jgi:hypothetical protein
MSAGKAGETPGARPGGFLASASFSKTKGHNVNLFLLGRTWGKNVSASSAEKYPVTAIGVKHLVQRGSTDDLLVRFAVFWAIRHWAARD